jgi:uncharacterized membrane protein YeiH
MNFGRVVQWENASLTRKRSLVQSQSRPPCESKTRRNAGLLFYFRKVYFYHFKCYYAIETYSKSLIKGVKNMTLLDVFVYFGVIAAAISGALLGVKKKLDFFGIIVLGVATALGGGIMRDILIGYIPPVALRQPVYTIISTVAALLVMFFPRKFGNRTRLIVFFDAIGLGVFTAVGTNMALQHNMSSVFMAITIGVISGVGGGVVRDIFAQEIPLIFKKEIYATASIIGALSLIISRNYMSNMIPLYICFIVTVVIRLTAIYFGIHQSNLSTGKFDIWNKNRSV